MFTVYFYNFGYSAQQRFKTMAEAKAYGDSTGFEYIVI